ncbi:hypothetical protein [Aureimonas frigidaquae]|nr:hypothetical protein [Aureimonas frigidaquae]
MNRRDRHGRIFAFAGFWIFGVACLLMISALIYYVWLFLTQM